MKMCCPEKVGFVLGLYWDNGKYNGNCYIVYCVLNQIGIFFFQGFILKGFTMAGCLAAVHGPDFGCPK